MAAALPMFSTVAIIGPGLIGGSMGMAFRECRLARTVIGIGRRRESLDKALAVGAIDKATLDPADGVKNAELVVLATPVGTVGEMARQVADALRAEALVTDVASTKAHVIEAVSSALWQRPDVSYIPTHPMAGSEQSGPEAADPNLFQGATCIITPLSNTFPESKSRIARMWQAMGARVVSMTPQAHDRTVARISHLPHLAAAALVAALEPDEMKLCGHGLLDTTRVASASPRIWLDICKTNREEVGNALHTYLELLQGLADALDDGNLGHVRSLLEAAKAQRDRLVESRGADERPAAP